MKKKYILFILMFIFFIILAINTKSYAADLDRIVNYNVTVEPRMNDGTLDITYEITWKVLDSTTEGPLEWVQIGTPNENFDNIRSLSTNIRSIDKYNGPFVKIVFDKKYYAGEQITFKYKIHQSYMYKISWGKCKYSFTPAWFTDAKVENMTIKWNKDSVKSNNAKTKEDNYLVWKKTDMEKGEKITAEIQYDKEAFGQLDSYKQFKSSSNDTDFNYAAMILFFVIIIIIISLFGRGGGYYGHRGFYGRRYGGYHRGGCVHSSCACAHSSCASSRSSCACACAGSGRAGCSKKDFYGTKINKDKLKKAFKDN